MKNKKEKLIFVLLLSIILSSSICHSRSKPNERQWNGRSISYGRIFSTNSQLAEQLTKAAEQGDMGAQYDLADMYRRGDGVAINQEKATQWYSIAFKQFYKEAEQGNADAQFVIGRMYSNGQGVNLDPKKADEWYSKATEQLTKSAEQGNVDAQFMLGLSYLFKSEGSAQDQKKALECWTAEVNQGVDILNLLSRMAKQGDADSQFAIGWVYFNLKVADQGLKKEAAGWYFEAAKQGHIGAQKALIKEAEQGDANFQFAVGKLYFDGEGVNQDQKKALEWWVKASEQGYVQAQITLTKVAEQIQADTQFAIGELYSTGKGIKVNKTEAYNWWLKAAKKGQAQAQKNLDLLCKESPWACK